MDIGDAPKINKIKRQIKLLKDAGCEFIVGDHITDFSDDRDRKALSKVLEEIKNGDLLIFDELNRLGRKMALYIFFYQCKEEYIVGNLFSNIFKVTSYYFNK